MQEKSQIKTKILQYLDFKKISKYKFYQETGITRGILDQNNGITEDNLLKFVQFAQDISLYWLINGTGPMLTDANFQPIIKPPIQSGNSGESILLQLIREKDARIEELNRIIGRQSVRQYPIDSEDSTNIAAER
jgi:hypothetical protein